MNEKGKLIVFEGLDGAGTTTQMKILGQAFEKEGRNVFLTHEPTDNSVGKLVRAALQKKFTLPSTSLALLYASDRDDHLYNKEYGIIKHLENGDIVISDRYFYSSIAYQGVECDINFLLSINSRFIDADYIIFVDTPIEECMKRIEKRGEEKELFEKEEYLKKVRDNYLKLFSSLDNSTTLIQIDGRMNIDEISKAIIKELKALKLL